MEPVYAKITLINALDISQANDHVLGEEKIRKLEVDMQVGGTADMLCINEPIRNFLDLYPFDRRKFLASDGKVLELDIVGTIRIIFGNRVTCCGAVVVPEDFPLQLGRITMEALDVIIDPATRKLIIHPDRPVPTLRNMTRINPPTQQPLWNYKKN